ncbi:alpha/beta hydrolase [Acetobacter sp. P5B1]|uniref:alpha/beta hydrolase n=1 Tax=Acetobacter sp. P5B1 TaxID=2762620 RepID=UPI00207B4204|nr:alpha/beta fold hydrolase [Acetobacter sp. P5B1]
MPVKLMWKYLYNAAAILFFSALSPIAAHAQSHPAPGMPISSINSGMNERVVNIPLRDGGSVRALLCTPAHPRAILIMFPGGSGDIGLEQNGSIRHGNNFVVRTRGLWNQRHYAVLIPDTINHLNLRGHRSSASYARVIDDILTFVHKERTAPVFLFGTSQGAIAAVNSAAHTPPGTLSGVVVSEAVSVMGGSKETVFNAPLQDIPTPALIVANQSDRCNVAPPHNADRIAASMTSSPDVQILRVTGGLTKSKKTCGSLSPHGYFGIEDDVIAKISAWMETKLK